jgi:hypothetical protein
MVTQFITVEIDLKDLDRPLQDVIETHLKTQGEPLRWAITAVTQGIAQVEAVIVQNVNA